MKHKLRLYGVRAPAMPPRVRPMTQIRLPKGHPCYGCPFIDCQGTVAYCHYFSCLCKNYEKWRRQQQAEYISRRKSKEVAHD